jgi:biopolymer transport protein TolR
VTLRADKALPYGDVMTVMGEINRAGVQSIALVTDSSVSVP